MRPRSGFTLIEVVLVLALAGIMLSIVMPQVDVIGLRATSSERQVGLAVMTAQYRAVLRQHDVRVSFDTIAGHLTVHEDVDNDGASDAGEPLQIVALEEGIRFTRAGLLVGGAGEAAVSFRPDAAGVPTVTFHRHGAASEAGGVYVGVDGLPSARRAGYARMLLLERATGRLTWHYLRGGPQGSWEERGR